MNFRKSLLSASLVLLLVPGISAASSAPAEAGAKKDKPAAADSANPLSALKEGMPAEAVRKLLGKPGEIKPMKAPEGKAEVWVFTREISRRVEQMQITTPDVIVNMKEPDGSTRQHITPGQVQMQDVHYLTEETAELLMFNDRYVVHKVSRGERKL